MKKFIKWFVFWTLVLGGVALAICYVAIPERTKSAMDIVVDYMNKPLFIGGGVVITVGMVFFVLIKAYSHYVINSNKIELENYKSKVEELVKQAKDYESIAKGHYDKLIEKENELFDKIEKVENEVENEVVEVCETIPNAKVKKLGQTIKEKHNGGEETVND